MKLRLGIALVAVGSLALGACGSAGNGAQDRGDLAQGLATSGTANPPPSSTANPPPSSTAAPSPTTTTAPAPAGTAANPVNIGPAYLQARCSAPNHGPVDAYQNWSGLSQRLVGQWFACDRSPAYPDVFNREAGIEFHADGTWNLLRLMPDGSFVPLRGIDSEGHWLPKYTGYTDVQLSLADRIEVTTFAFESAPQRARATNSSRLGEVTTWLVPLERAPD